MSYRMLSHSYSYSIIYPIHSSLAEGWGSWVGVYTSFGAPSGEKILHINIAYYSFKITLTAIFRKLDGILMSVIFCALDMSLTCLPNFWKIVQI